MTNLKKIKRAFLALMIGLLLGVPAAAQDGMNPLIPGGNSAPPGHAPKAVVANPLYDFGSALEGTMVSHTFTIKNNGQGYLDIRGVKTSCGCTTGNPSKTHVAPGDESEIAVSFDTHFQKGHQVRTITAFTNDPDNPQVAMTMQGMIKKQVEAQPGEISFGNVKKGTEDTRELVVNDLNPARAVPGRSGEQLEFFDQGGAGKASRRQAGRAAQSLAAQDDAGGAVRRHDQDHHQSRAVAG